jgi:TonB family protein
MLTEAGLPAFFGRYQVLEELGSGAMGIVYLCVDPRLARPVAVKVLRALDFASPAERQQYEARFRNEAEAAGRLNHPGIVQIYDIGPTYLVMEFLEGRPLSAALREGAVLTIGQVGSMILRVADAVDYAHKNGIVHRDIKPANIMLMGDGGVKVLDFGVARLESSTLTAMGTILGSVRYMAPEQMMGQRIDGRADIFSLAAVAYELLTRQAPFPGKTITEVVSRVVHGGHVPPREVDPRLPETANGVFARAFSVRPEQRPAKAMDLARELQEALRAVSEVEIRHPIEGGAPTTILNVVPQPEVAPIRPAAPTGETILLNPSPSRREALLMLESDPPGGRVYLDGNPAGLTPLFALEVSFGRHVLRVEAAGRDPVSVDLELTREQALKSLSLTLPLPSTGGPPRVGRLVPFGPEMTPPRRISGAIPVYPETARERGIEGSPVVDLLIGEDGHVLDARIIDSAGALLDGALMEAVGGWRFSAASSQGVVVSVRVRVQHVFRC